MIKIRKNKEMWILTLIAILTGFSITRAVAIQNPEISFSKMLSPASLNRYLESQSLNKMEEYIVTIGELEMDREALLEELKELEELKGQHEKRIASMLSEGDLIKDELKHNRLIAGLTDLEGPGIEISLDDRKVDTILDSDYNLLSYYIVHDIDLLEVVNHLKAEGAEAISINGSRIIENSRISCGGPTINVGKEQRFTPPFIIRAIGDPEELVESFHQSGSIYDRLSYWGLRFDIKKMDRVEMPRYIGEVDYKYALPLERSN